MGGLVFILLIVLLLCFYLANHSIIEHLENIEILLESNKHGIELTNRLLIELDSKLQRNENRDNP